MRTYIPVTPGGTVCIWLEADSEEKAIENLLADAAHMPYRDWAEFKERGYTIEYTDE